MEPRCGRAGPLPYDPAGNITTMGVEQFYYHEVSCLERAEVALGAATHTEDYAYDRFGNLIVQKITGRGHIDLWMGGSL